jgi:aldose 1-epimerase
VSAVPVSADQRAEGDSALATLRVGDCTAEVLAYGAHLVGLWTPDRDGRSDNVVVSLRSPGGAVDLAAYRDPVRNPHLGGIAGRYANRIAGAAFELDGVRHRLVPNEGPNQLHGGPVGFDRREWSLATHADERSARAVLGLVSDDGDQGFPGRVEAQVTYRLTVEGELHIEARATTDAATVVNLTNHTYWNLSGTASPLAATAASIAGHRLRVAAERVVEVDGGLLPTGHLEPVAGSVFDLRSPVPLGEILDRDELSAVGGLDHCYVLTGTSPAAELVDPASGRRIRVRTDQPGLQVYTANHGAGPLPRHGAVCLESQHLPDSPNQPTFPSPLLRPGATYRHDHVVQLDLVG